MHGLPRVGAGAGPERLRPVLQACLGRLTFTYQQNRVVLPNVTHNSQVVSIASFAEGLQPVSLLFARALHIR